MYLIGFCCMLLHCWRCTVQRICTSLSPLSCFSHVHTESAGVQPLWRAVEGRDMLLYFLFPLKTDVKSNKKFLSLLPICIIKCYWHNLANQHQPNRQENRPQFILTSHGLHKIPSKLIKVYRHFVFQERFPPCIRRKIQYWCCIKQIWGEET